MAFNVFYYLHVYSESEPETSVMVEASVCLIPAAAPSPSTSLPDSREPVDGSDSASLSPFDSLMAETEMDYSASATTWEQVPPSIREQLRRWALRNNITLAATSELLKILFPLVKDLPLDARTLLETPRNLRISENLTYISLVREFKEVLTEA